MNNKDRNKNYILVIIGVVLSLALCLLFIMGYKEGISTDVKTSSIKEYNDIQELQKSLTYEIDIPDIVLEQDIQRIQCTLGQITEIDSMYLVFKAAIFIDVHADPLGLYEQASVDNEYSVEDNEKGITYVRYRQQYPEYMHCTLLNWSTSSMSYALLIDNMVDLQEAVGLIGLTPDMLSEIENNTVSGNDISSDNFDMTWYDISNNIKIELPQFNSEYNIDDKDGLSICYLDGEILFVVIYDKQLMTENTFGGEGEVELGPDLIIRYPNENPFNKESLPYNYYNKFIDTIEDNSVNYLIDSN